MLCNKVLSSTSDCKPTVVVVVVVKLDDAVLAVTVVNVFGLVIVLFDGVIVVICSVVVEIVGLYRKMIYCINMSMG